MQDEITIWPMKEAEIDKVADIYIRAFNKVTNEDWSKEQAVKFITHWFHKQTDLFLVARIPGKIVGGVVGEIVPHHDGNKLHHLELFVDPVYQGRGIGKKLLKSITQKAINFYNIVSVAGIADSKVKFPMGWYEKIGFEKTQWVYIEGNSEELIDNL